jgi:hypothetical protein
MAGIIGAIGMVVSSMPTLMACRNHIIRYPLTKPLIEDKVYAQEFIG